MKKTNYISRMRTALGALAFIMLMPLAAMAATWNIPTLNNGDTATVTITVTVDAATGGTALTNTITHTQDQTDLDVSADDMDETINVHNDTEIVVTKTASDDTPDEGDTVTYTINVENQGPASLQALNLVDVIPSGLTYVTSSLDCDTGDQAATEVDAAPGGAGLQCNAYADIADGETVTMTYQVTVDAGTSGDTINNTVTNTQEQTDLDVEVDSETESITVNNDADIATTKEFVNNTTAALTALDQAEEGDSLTFTITTTNNGPAAVESLNLSDTLPSGYTLVASSLSCDSGTVSGDETEAATLVCDNFADIPVSGTAIMTYNVTVDSGTGASAIINTVVRTQDQTDSSTGPGDDDYTETVTILNNADIVLGKTVANITDTGAAAGTAEEGDIVEYTVTVTNNGPAELSNFTVNDIVPSGLTYVASSLSCSTGTPDATTPDSGTGLECDVGTLADSGSVTMTFRATVDAGEAGNTIGNTATTTQDQTDSNATADDASEDLDIDVVDIIIGKTANDLTPNEGDTVTYTITIENNGSAPITNVNILDNLPAGVTIDSLGTPSHGTITP